MADTNKSISPTVEKEPLPLMDFLAANREKLELLLSGNRKSTPLIHKISGKRKTRTIFLSEKLQFLMNEYCIEHEIPIADFCETAIVQYLVAHGCEEELKSILSLTESAQKENKK